MAALGPGERWLPRGSLRRRVGLARVISVRRQRRQRPGTGARGGGGRGPGSGSGAPGFFRPRVSCSGRGLGSGPHGPSGVPPGPRVLQRPPDPVTPRSRLWRRQPPSVRKAV
ncbi:unnamed protein product [Coccothraustes coccothraustes]